MTPAGLRLARFALRLYPRAWRERYEAELLALVEERGFGVGDFLDLLVGAYRERAFAPWNAPKPGTTARGMLTLAGFLFLVAVIASIGSFFAFLLNKTPTPPAIRDWLIGFVPLVWLAALVRGGPKWWRGMRSLHTSVVAAPPPPSRRETFFWVSMALLAATVGQWDFPPLNSLATWIHGATAVSLTLQFGLFWPAAGSSRRDYDLRRAEVLETLRRAAPRFPLGLGDDPR